MVFTWHCSKEKRINLKIYMKKFYTILLLFIAAAGFSQPPAGYYNSATGNGYTLKTQLFNIIKVSTDRGYSGL